MPTVDVRNADGSPAGSVELPADVFDAQANIALMHQVVVAQLAAARQGTHETKTRGEVSGGGRKPYRQKGTGRARQGSIRAPQFAGGGVVHGPTPRNYDQRTPKKMKAAALRGALSDRARDDRVHVVESFVDGDTPSTKAALAALGAITEARKVLVVLDRDDIAGFKSLRNVPSVHLLDAGQLNTYDVLVSDDVVFTAVAWTRSWPGPGTRSCRICPLTTFPASPSRRWCRKSARWTRRTTRSDRRPARRAPRSGRLGEELRPAGPEQVHVRRPPGREQDPDQDRDRADLQRDASSTSTRSTGRASASAPGPASVSARNTKRAIVRLAPGDRIESSADR